MISTQNQQNALSHSSRSQKCVKYGEKATLEASRASTSSISNGAIRPHVTIRGKSRRRGLNYAFASQSRESFRIFRTCRFGHERMSKQETQSRQNFPFATI